jgi:RHS repeat-associated protein
MTMPGRTYSSQSSYRYGFNGKEKDLEVASTTTYDYGFRIYNPALGRFLSVDPLFKSYPWYTPYQFAGNNPVRYIDLDGLEEIDPIIVIQEPKSKGEPGLAYTTATKVYFVVTSGRGSLSEAQQSEINVTEIHQQLNSTSNQPAFLTTLPGPLGGGGWNGAITPKVYDDLFSESERKKQNALSKIEDPFYAVTVHFKVSIIVNEGMTFEKISKIVASNPKLYGVIFNSVTDDQIREMNIDNDFKILQVDANEQFLRAAKYAERDISGEAEAYGSVLRPNTNPKNFDAIILNSNLSGAPTLNMTDRIIHEIGHNITEMSHGINYDYKQKGFQSNKSPAPNSVNKTSIITTTPNTNIYDKVVVKEIEINNT